MMIDINDAGGGKLEHLRERRNVEGSKHSKLSLEITQNILSPTLKLSDTIQLYSIFL